MRSILADLPHDPRQAVAPVRPYPAPVIGPFPAPENRTPGTAKEGEVQDNDGVGSPEPYVEGTVIGSEVAIQNPRLAPHQLALAFRPFGRVSGIEPSLPELGVQLGHRQAGHLAKLPGQG